MQEAKKSDLSMLLYILHNQITDMTNISHVLEDEE